jgi:serine/threonine protein kinase
MNIEQAVIRVYNQHNYVMGSGVLISDNQILTCAHVVSDALGIRQKSGPKPIQNVTIDFPFVAPEIKIPTTVIFWEPESDIACLELTDGPFRGTKPVFLVNDTQLQEHSFHAFGFPPNYDKGVWSTGVLRSRNAEGWIQIEDEKVPGYPIRPGFSGAPVWDDQLNAVVGIVVAADISPMIKAAYMIPTDILVQKCPLLNLHIKLPVKNFFEKNEETSDENPQFEAGKIFRLQGTKYLIRELIKKAVIDELSFHSLRASNLFTHQDVGICYVTRCSDQAKAVSGLHKVLIRAKAYTQAATNGSHLPHMLNITEPDTNTAWFIVEWLHGTSLDKYFPKNDSLPGRSELITLLGWTIDICDALSALHRQRISPACIHPGVIQINQEHKAVLTDPLFLVSSDAQINPLPAFNPAVDVTALAKTIFELSTHHPPLTKPASSYNPVIPETYDLLMQNVFSGGIQSPKSLKQELINVQLMMRSKNR